ncbi:MAG TPA: tetratricopeptide repeat protein [Caulobacteraceae bacterium]|nr:tetratricopeptide repeat protein [Caulobacteraceae bacterium]
MNAPHTPPSPPAGVEPMLEAGLACRSAGDLAGAERIFRQALSHDPRNATALFILGLTRFEAGDAAEADRLIEQATLLHPDNFQAQFTLASVRHWREARPAAIETYRRALELEPGHAGALIGLSRALAETGAFADALPPATRSVELAPADPAARMALAAARRGLGEVLAAAESFADAAHLAPDLYAAHVGQALALVDAGEAEAALAAAERAVAIDANASDGWIALGSALRGLHRPDAARVALEAAVTLDPNRAVGHLYLGLALIDLERAPEARRHLERALELDPTSAQAHANLSSLFMLAGRKSLAKAHARRALDIDPDLMSAHQNLAAVLADEQQHDEARDHRDRAYTERSLLITTASRPLARVLVLTTTESGNTPDRYLIPPSAYTRLLWFIEYATDAQMAELPEYDVAFNAIGDEDLAGPTAANARRFADICPKRLLNHPDLIARTRRDRAEALFGGIDGVVVPRTVRIETAELTDGDLRGAAARAGIEAPFLVRPIGSHGGKGLLLAGGDAPDEPPPPAMAYYLTEFVDFRSADGLYRKYRTVFVDGRPLPYHLAVSPKWMVHYESSGMDRHPDRLAEEMRFLENPAAALGTEAAEAIASIGAAMRLDYAGVDFTLTPDGRVLLFEANATMLVHPEARDGALAHKNPYIDRIFTAFRTMLAAPLGS